MTESENGRVVEVLTPRPGGEPSSELFFVAVDDDVEAENTVRRRFQLPAAIKIKSLGQLRAGTVDVLGMQSGDVWHA